MNPMQRYQAWLRSRSPHMLSGAVRMDIAEDGTISYLPAIGGSGRPMASLDEANAAIDAFGATRVHKPATGHTSRWTPVMVRDFQQHMQEQYGGRVELFSFRTESDAQWGALQDLVQRRDSSGRKQLYGWMVPDDEVTTLLRAFVGEEEWTSDRLLREMEKVYGFSVEALDPESGKLGIFGSKFHKRAKATITNKTFEMLSDQPIKIALIDSSSLQQLGKLNEHYEQVYDLFSEAQKAEVGSKTAWVRSQMDRAARDGSDGISFGSRALFERMANYQDELLATLRQEHANALAGGKTFEARSIMGEITSLERDLKGLRSSIERGSGVWNMRIMGGKAFGVDLMAVGGEEGFYNLKGISAEGQGKVSETLRKMQEMGWQGKGNVLLDDRITRAAGADLVTDYGNIKFEFGFTERILGKGRNLRSLLTLNPFESSNRVLLDEQTITSNPDIFNRQYITELTEGTLEQFNESIKALRQDGIIPSQLRSLIEAQVNSPDLIRGQRAKNLLRAIDNGYDIRMDAGMMEAAINTIRDSMFKTQHGIEKLNIELPATVRGEIVPFWAMQGRDDVRVMKAAADMPLTGPMTAANLPELQFNSATGTYIMAEADAARFKAAFGGFDFDDAIFSMLRLDPESGEIVGMSIRQPNAAGEFVAFRVSAEDDLISDHIKRVGSKATQKQYREYTKALQKLRRGLRTAKTQSAEENLRIKIADLESRIHGIATDHLQEANYISGKLARSGVSGRSASVKMMMGDKSFRFLGESDLLQYMDIDDLSSGLNPKALDEINRLMMSGGNIASTAKGMPKTEHTLLDQMAILNRHFADEPQRMNTIGMYINPRMVLDSWMGTHAEAASQYKPIMDKLRQIRLIETEALIDIAKDPQQVRRAAEELVEQIFEIQTIATGMDAKLGFDPILDERRLGSFSVAKEKGMERGNEVLREMGRAEVLSMESLYMAEDDARAVFPQIRKIQDQINKGTAEFLADIQVSDELRSYQAARNSKYTDISKRIMRATVNRGEDLDGFAYYAQRAEPIRKSFGILAETFDTEGYATSDTYKTILRMMQLAEDSPGYRMALEPLHAIASSTGGGIAEGDLLLEAQRFLRGEVTNLYSIRDLYQSMEMLTDEGVYKTLDTLLNAQGDKTSLTAKMVRDVDEGMRAVYGDFGEMPLSRHARDVMSDANVFADGAKVSRPMSLATLMKFQDDQTTINNLLYRYSQATDPSIKQEIADTVTRNLTTMHQDMTKLATMDPDIPDILRDNVIRAMERGGDDSGADIARGIVEKTKRTTSGGTFNRMTIGSLMDNAKSFGYGKIAVGAAAVGVMVAYNRKRNKDYTLNDMQGPAFMPGGTPYSEGFDEAVQVAMSRESLQGYPDGGGTMYQVRTRGGSYGSDLASSLSAVTGGSVTGSMYDAPLPFQNESARDTILRRYS